MIRKATEADLALIVKIYEAILTREEEGLVSIGWIRGVYPTKETAEDALAKGTLFVCEEEGQVVAAAKIDRNQVPEYADCPWEREALEEQVMVLHTLVVDPDVPRRGYGRAFVRFYEQYARENACPYLRIDTNERNAVARKMYQALGYREAGIVPCVFNGIPNVRLVCLEKYLG